MGRFMNLSKIKEQAELIEFCSYGERKDGAD